VAVLRTQLGVHRDTRQRILDTARRLFSDSGYLGVSMNDIARHLGITKAALYHHFKGKAAIYAAVLDDVFSGLRAQVADAVEQETAEGRLRRLIKNYLEFGLREKSLITIIVTKLPPDEPTIRQRVVHFREELADQVQPIVEQNLAKDGLARVGETRFVTSLLMWMMDGLLLECSLFEKMVDTAKVADHILGILGQRSGSIAGAQAH